MKSLEFINSYWSTIITTLTTLAGIVSAIITYIKTKSWNSVKDTVSKYVQEAEKLNAEGILKKEIVMAKIRTLCVERRIKFNEQKVSAMIENVLELTKTVNARAKDKIAEEK